MVNRFDDTGCWAGEGEFVSYTDFRKLEIADDVFQKKVNNVLKDLTDTPEDVNAQYLNDAINDAIGQLEKAFSGRKE